MAQRNFVNALYDSRGLYTDVRARRIIQQITKFSVDGKYTTYKKAKEIVLTSRLSVEEASSIVGISARQVAKERSNVSRALYNLFGVDFFIQLQQGNFDQLEITVRNAIEGVKLEDYFPLEVIYDVDGREQENTSGAEPRVYMLSECTEELKFMGKYSKLAIKEDLSRLDIDKLSYLFSLVRGKGTAKDRDGVVEEIIRASKRGS